MGPVHGIVLSRDGQVYVTDRRANRVQVFQRSGEFVQEGFISPETTDLGTGYGVALSHDPEQQWVYINAGSNNKATCMSARLAADGSRFRLVSGG